MWAVMERLGYKSLPDELNGPKIHRLENVMTLAPGCHSKFDQLEIWFVATVRSTSPWIGLTTLTYYITAFIRAR
jgi:hypothetical protein